MKKKKRLRLISAINEEEEFVVTDDQLDQAIHYLELQRKKSKGTASKGNCTPRERCAIRVERHAMLFCRQLPNVIDELRKSILRQEWREVTALFMLLCQTGLTRHSSVIIRTCLLLLLNHQKSSIDLLEKFVRSCTGYVLDEDVKKFIKMLFALRNELLPVLKSGKFIRNTTTYRVIDEMYFKDL